jgi:localization factor PodJL
MIAEARAAAFAPPTSFASEAPEADGGMTFADLGARRPRPTHAMRGALLAGGAAAFMGLAGAGYVALHPEMMRAPGAPAANPIPVGPPSAPAAAPAQAAVALATAPTPKPAGQDLDSLYRDAAAKVDNGDASGVASLRTAANLGYAPAQRRLGKLYEDGGVGVAKDPVEGRRWTLRAAANGDVRAMHNLALDYYQGVGGPKSPAIAAQYFQRAAELGLRDSQYNLARFLEAGIGAPQDLAGAYRWYLIAARGGDTEAQTRAEALKPRLTAEQQARAQALAGAFQPDPAAAPASLVALLRASNPKQLALAQRALAKLGYYKGPDDGAASQALGEAIQSYQRERGLAANGQLSPELLQTFAHIAQ